MAFVNERTTNEDREKYLKCFESFISYYPMDWTINRVDTSILFMVATERGDMFDPQLEAIYGEYIRTWWIFIYKEVCINVEFLRPKKIIKDNLLVFIAREIRVLDGQVLNLKDILNKLHDAMQVSKGYGIFLPKNENYDVEVDFSGIFL